MYSNQHHRQNLGLWQHIMWYATLHLYTLALFNPVIVFTKTKKLNQSYLSTENKISETKLIVSLFFRWLLWFQSQEDPRWWLGLGLVACHWRTKAVTWGKVYCSTSSIQALLLSDVLFEIWMQAQRCLLCKWGFITLIYFRYHLYNHIHVNIHFEGLGGDKLKSSLAFKTYFIKLVTLEDVP